MYFLFTWTGNPPDCNRPIGWLSFSCGGTIGRVYEGDSNAVTTFGYFQRRQVSTLHASQLRQAIKRVLPNRQHWAPFHRSMWEPWINYNSASGKIPRRRGTCPACSLVSRRGNLLPTKVALGGKVCTKSALFQNYDDGTTEKPYGHALVAGVDRYPRKVTKGMGKKKIKQRSKIKAFVKVYNYNHLMPTR